MAKAQAASKKSNKRVLQSEDDPKNKELLHDHRASNGSTPVESDDGVITKEKPASKSCDALLLDVLMSRPDGTPNITLDDATQAQHDKSLDESEAKLRLITETIQDVFWISTPGIERIIYVSPAYETLWGRTCESLYLEPHSFTDAIHPEDRPKVFSALKEHAQGNWNIEYRIIRPNGSVRWIEDRGFSVRNGSGELIQMCGVASDITRRKLAEKALHKVVAKLIRVEERERRRIARELHDCTGQTLATLAMAVGRIHDTVSIPDNKTEKMFTDCETMIEQCTREIRTLSYLLHPPLLEEMGLATALCEYTDEFSKRSGVEIALVMPPHLERLPNEYELALFRIVQECLGNIRIHAGAATASINLVSNEQQIVLEVSGKVRGMAARKLRAIESGRRSAGVGIAGMRERLRLIGGRLEIEANRNGATVRAIIPHRECVV